MSLPAAQTFAFASAFPERDALSGLSRHQLIEAIGLGSECMTLELQGADEEAIKDSYRHGILRLRTECQPVPAMAAE